MAMQLFKRASLVLLLPAPAVQAESGEVLQDSSTKGSTAVAVDGASDLVSLGSEEAGSRSSIIERLQQVQQREGEKAEGSSQDKELSSKASTAVAVDGAADLVSLGSGEASSRSSIFERLQQGLEGSNSKDPNAKETVAKSLLQNSDAAGKKSVVVDSASNIEDVDDVDQSGHHARVESSGERLMRKHKAAAASHRSSHHATRGMQHARENRAALQPSADAGTPGAIEGWIQQEGACRKDEDGTFNVLKGLEESQSSVIGCAAVCFESKECGSFAVSAPGTQSPAICTYFGPGHSGNLVAGTLCYVHVERAVQSGVVPPESTINKLHKSKKAQTKKEVENKDEAEKEQEGRGPPGPVGPPGDPGQDLEPQPTGSIYKALGLCFLVNAIFSTLLFVQARREFGEYKEEAENHAWHEEQHRLYLEEKKAKAEAREAALKEREEKRKKDKEEKLKAKAGAGAPPVPAPAAAGGGAAAHHGNKK